MERPSTQKAQVCLPSQHQRCLIYLMLDVISSAVRVKYSA